MEGDVLERIHDGVGCLLGLNARGMWLWFLSVRRCLIDQRVKEALAGRPVYIHAQYPQLILRAYAGLVSGDIPRGLVSSQLRE